DPARDLANSPLDEVLRFRSVRPDRSSHFDPIRHNIVSVTTGNPGHRYDCIVDRVDLPRDDGLHRLDHEACRYHRISALVGHGRVTAETFHLDREPVGRRHHWPGTDAELAGGEIGPVVETVDALSGEALE